MPNVLSPRDLVSRPNKMDRNCSTHIYFINEASFIKKTSRWCTLKCYTTNLPLYSHYIFYGSPDWIVSSVVVDYMHGTLLGVT